MQNKSRPAVQYSPLNDVQINTFVKIHHQQQQRPKEKEEINDTGVNAATHEVLDYNL